MEFIWLLIIVVGFFVGYLASVAIPAKLSGGLSIGKRVLVGIPMFLVGYVASLLIASVAGRAFGLWASLLVAVILMFVVAGIAHNVYRKMEMRDFTSG